MSNKTLFGIMFGIVAIAGVIFVSSVQAPTPHSHSSTANLSSLSSGPAPWPVEVNHLADRLAALRIPALGAEGGAEHIHQHLDIYINGKQTDIPADIGIDQQASFISPVHTHDTSGIIHIESPTANANYYLGQLFTIWGVKFTDHSIGGYSTNTTNKLLVYDNGVLVNDPVHLKLTAHAEIVVIYGSENEQPSIPKSYKFSSGL